MPYGAGFNLANRQANGGFVSTVVDYARFLDALRWNRNNPLDDLLSPMTLRRMMAGVSVSNNNYAHGFAYTPNYTVNSKSTGSAAVLWNGIKEGTESEFRMFVNQGAGLATWQNAAMVAFFNSDLQGTNVTRLGEVLTPLLPSISDWGTVDLFDLFSVTP